MRHRNSGVKLGRTSSHRKAMFQNLANSLFEHELIKTTVPKAKELRGFVEKLITKAGEGGDHAHKFVFAALQDKECTKKLVNEIAPKYLERNGGYTRIVKTRIRKGDAAPMAFLELV